MTERTTSSAPQPGEQVESLGTLEGRTFDEKGVAEILQRAARLERRRSEGTELTLAEIEQIARESGIDPALVRQAVRELELSREKALSTKLAGAPLRTVFERVIKGEISAADHEALVNEIREGLGVLGTEPPQISSIGRSLTVTARDPGRTLIEVHLAPRAGHTVLRVSINSGRRAGSLFGALVGGIGGGVGTQAAIMSGTLLTRAFDLPAPAGVAIGLSAFLAVAGTGFALARTLFSRSVSKTTTSLERLGDRLELQLSRPR